MTSVALAGAVALGGCETDDVATAVAGARAMRPLPPALAAELDKKNMPRESPILVRIFKEESEFEVWKQNTDGKFALLKTYPICRWSGELGPKVKEGDRQAPEGFYTITPGQMNPTSNYYLAFNLGFPNAYDRANDHTGAFLMVHGDCSSAGCYAMTDEQIQEIYALGRDLFLGGQKSFQVQAYPFRMTALNLARHRTNPAMPFWRMIKEGNDHFEVTKKQPQVDVCEKRYVFDARKPANASTPLVFHGKEKCPVYELPEEIATLVKTKQANDDKAFAELVDKGTPTVAVKTGTDGGMHPVFLAKLQPTVKPVFDFQTGQTSEIKAPPGPLPPYVNPPRAPAPTADAGSEAGAKSSTLTAVSRWLGLGGAETPAEPVATATELVPVPKPKPAQPGAKSIAATTNAPPAAKPPKPPNEAAAAPAPAAPAPVLAWPAPTSQAAPVAQTATVAASPGGSVASR